MTLVIFENKPKILHTSVVHDFIAKELYQRYFLIWLFFTTNCYDEHHSKISIYRSVKVKNAMLKCYYVESIIKHFFILFSRR